MLTLAFDTSSKTASVSVLRNETILYNTVINKGLNHSEVLLPTFEEALRNSGIMLPEIDLFACTLGPGSFTGLRIGVSTIKGLMMATGKPAVGVSSLAALALNVREEKKIIGSMMDAGRGQVYLAYYRSGKDDLLYQLQEEKAIDPKDMVDPYEAEVIYVGDGAIQYASFINSSPMNKNKIAPPEKQFICASFVGRLALEKYRRNDLLDLVKDVPVYLRSSDALPKKSTFM